MAARLSLKDVQSTRRDAPICALVYGGGGVGKSTFAASAPKPIFLTTENGLINIDAKALSVQLWQDLLDSVDLLIDEAHEYETVVIDSLDECEPLCWDYVCKLGKKKNIEAFGYGDGYSIALDHWRVLLNKLELVRAKKGMNIVLIAHALLSTVKNPEGSDYDRWSIKLQDGKKTSLAGKIFTWCDNVGFASHEVLTEDTTGRAKGIATGRRTLRFQPSAAYNAKTRYTLPKVLPLDWRVFSQAVREGGPAAIERLKGELEAKIRELGDEEVESNARAYVAQRGVTVPSLTEAIATLDDYLAEKKKAS